VLAGVNHFTWMLRLNDRRTGEDITGDFIGRLRASGALVHSQTGLLLDETGCWGPNGDGHMRDFLPPCRYTKALEATSHGTPEDRERRLTRLRDTAAGREPWGWLIEHRAWEKPIDFVAAVAFGRECDIHSLNLANTGQIPNLPRGVFVETPARATSRGLTPRELSLPESVAGYCRSAVEVTDMIVRAYREGSLKLARRAVELDPTILDKQAGMEALGECLRAHADVLPRFKR
jgi:alpha-galactosidase/6-phospho-beta-glucosidase family protein